MEMSRAKTVLKYVLSTILSQCSFFLFTIIDGIFVGPRSRDRRFGCRESCDAFHNDNKCRIYAGNNRRRYRYGNSNRKKRF